MADVESRDAYLAVAVPLPNGASIQGRPVGFLAARKMIAKLEEFIAGGPSQETFDAVWREFTALTGITEAALLALCPDITLGEVIDVMQRFFYRRRDLSPVVRDPQLPPTAGTTGG